MNKNVFNLIVVLLVIVIGIVLVLYYKGDRSTDVDKTQQTTQETRSPEVQKAVDKFKETLTTKHQYEDGRHVFLGNFEVPNRCYNYKLTVNDVQNDKVIEIDYVEPEIKDCPSPEPVMKKFVSSFSAPEDQNVRAKINGEEVNLNIVEVPAGEDIAEY